MSETVFNINKCWARLKGKPYKQCSYKQSVGHFCKKHYVLWKKGSIISIHNNVHNDFNRKNPIYSNLNKYIIKIQSLYRGIRVRKNIKLRGISVYCRHLSNNKTDCINLQSIYDVSIDNYFSFIENDIYWGFSIDSFKHILKYNYTNPYSTKELSNKVIDRFDILNKPIKNPNKKCKITKGDTEFINHKYIKLQQECVHVFQLIDELNNYTKCSWFLSLSLLKLKSLYRFMEDLWNYRLNLTKEQKLNYISNGILFNIPFADIKKNKSYYNIAYTLLKEFKRLLIEGKTKSDKTTASHWILSGITLVDQDARNSLPWLYQSAAL